MILLWLVIFLLLFGVVLLDCGCNKQKRETINFPEVNTVVNQNENTDELKVCQQNAVKSNQYYRDYYSESVVKVEEGQEPQISNMSFIPGGNYFIGTNEPHFREDNEAPERSVQVKDFYIDKYEVSNNKFKKFVEATKYTTEAERFGDSFVFKMLLNPEMQKKYEDYRVVSAPWWFKVKGVSWRHPNGPKSTLKGIEEHPVVHVSWHDADAYCKWVGKRLPTEAEWETACRGGKKRKLFPWGNKLMPNEKHWLNIWQGDFPDQNTAEDGFAHTCPVNEFRQNSFDVYNMVGNVWEWTQDFWHSGDTGVNPHYVKKGGSYLCHESYCYRYRCAARSQNTADSSSGNLGFRCVKDL